VKYLIEIKWYINNWDNVWTQDIKFKLIGICEFNHLTYILSNSTCFGPVWDCVKELKNVVLVLKSFLNKKMLVWRKTYKTLFYSKKSLEEAWKWEIFFLKKKKKKLFLTFSIDKNCISQYNPNQALIYNPISSSYINNMRDDSMQLFFFFFFFFFILEVNFSRLQNAILIPSYITK
jgi:hypothetical protein